MEIPGEPVAIDSPGVRSSGVGSALYRNLGNGAFELELSARAR